jgi:hypothetical protein
MRTSFRHQSEAQPPNGPLTAAASPDTPSHMPSHAVRSPPADMPARCDQLEPRHLTREPKKALLRKDNQHGQAGQPFFGRQRHITGGF